MNASEGLLLCPFSPRLLPACSREVLRLVAKQHFYPPYRFLLHGDIRSVVLVRRMLFDGQSVMRSFDTVRGGGEDAVSGEVFGPLLLPFWGPECPQGGEVTIEVQSQNCAAMTLAATLLASSEV